MTKIPAAPAADADAAPEPTVPRRGRNAGDTRVRILDAARKRFSRDAYENVGTRDIAAEAGVDAALVNRYFGSKEKLFAEVIAGAFCDRSAPSTAFAGHAVRRPPGSPRDGRQGQARRGRLRPAAAAAARDGQPGDAGALVSACFHAEFVQPLGKLLRGRDAEVRAALIASYVIGLATMKHGLGSPALGPGAQRRAVALAGAAIQACVTG